MFYSRLALVLRSVRRIGGLGDQLVLSFLSAGLGDLTDVRLLGQWLYLLRILITLFVVLKVFAVIAPMAEVRALNAALAAAIVGSGVAVWTAQEEREPRVLALMLSMGRILRLDGRFVELADALLMDDLDDIV